MHLEHTFFPIACEILYYCKIFLHLRDQDVTKNKTPQTKHVNKPTNNCKDLHIRHIVFMC